MALVSKTLKIDLWQKMRERITVVRREILGRSLTFQLYSGSLPVNLTGCTVTFYAIKPDGTIVFNACSLVTAASGICSYTFTEQTILLAGDLTCQLLIVDGSSNELRTQEFTIEVQASSDFTTSAESSSEYNTFSAALASIMNKAGGATYPFTAMPYVGTAPVVESGSGYVKYADGTMICTGRLSVEATANTLASVVWTFPATFYSAILAICTASISSYSVGDFDLAAFYTSINWGGDQNRTVLLKASVSQTYGIDVIAIGRWKA